MPKTLDFTGENGIFLYRFLGDKFKKSSNKFSSGPLTAIEIFLEKWYNIGAVGKQKEFLKMSD